MIASLCQVKIRAIGAPLPLLASRPVPDKLCWKAFARFCSYVPTLPYSGTPPVPIVF